MVCCDMPRVELVDSARPPPLRLSISHSAKHALDSWLTVMSDAESANPNIPSIAAGLYCERATLAANASMPPSEQTIRGESAEQVKDDITPTHCTRAGLRAARSARILGDRRCALQQQAIAELQGQRRALQQTATANAQRCLTWSIIGICIAARRADASQGRALHASIDALFPVIFDFAACEPARRNFLDGTGSYVCMVRAWRIRGDLIASLFHTAYGRAMTAGAAKSATVPPLRRRKRKMYC